MTTDPLRIRTLAQLRAVLGDGSGLVITDTASDRIFHPDPRGCTRVREERFVTKVVENAERNGSYFAVASISDARETWPDITRCRSAACSAALGAATGEGDWPGDDEDAFRRVLKDVTGSDIRSRDEPPQGVEALIGSWRTTQRVALGHWEATIVLASWPAELKGQAHAVYGSETARAIVELVADSDLWAGEPTPHLAFNGAKPGDRFYLPCPLSLPEYVDRWSRPENLREVREHAADTIRPHLWPWLMDLGMVDGGRTDNVPRLDRYMGALERRRSGAHIRPGIALRRRCDDSGPERLRRDADAAFSELRRALGEPAP